MATEIEIHSIQAEILKALLFKPEARFSELNSGRLPTDQFTFHLKRLISDGLVSKDNNAYTLTPTGKEFANRFDTEKVEVERQAKLSILVICVKKRKNLKEYLIHQRLKQPYYGFHGFITGKMRWGETAAETALRELKEEANLTGKPIFAGIEHKMDYSPDGSFLEDKYFFIFRFENPKGKVSQDFQAGKNFWASKNQIIKLPNLQADMRRLLKIINSHKLSFIESKFTVSGY